MLELIRRLPHPWQDAMFGAILGDALGVPHEFHTADKIPMPAQIEMLMPAGFHKTYTSIPYGTWSDDGSQLLALLHCLLVSGGRYDENAVVNALLAWRYKGHYQAGGEVFDIGLQTESALQSWSEGSTWEGPLLGLCGNGSLMRVLPIALMPMLSGCSDEEALQAAMAQSRITHPNWIATVACALYVELCWMIERRPGIDWRSAVLAASEGLRNRKILSDYEEAEDLARILQYGQTSLPTGSGMVIDTFWSAIWALERSSSTSEALRLAISLGKDTDTVACVTGGLAGLAFGLDETCIRWIGELRDAELPLLA